MAFVHKYVVAHESDTDAVIQAAVDAALHSDNFGTVSRVNMKYTEGIDQGDQEITISIVGDDASLDDYVCSFVRYWKHRAAATIEAGVEAGIAAAGGISYDIDDHDICIDENVNSDSQIVAFLTILH